MQSQHRSGLVGEVQDADVQKFASEVVSFKKGSAGTPADVAAVLTWLNSQGVWGMTDVYKLMPGDGEVINSFYACASLPEQLLPGSKQLVGGTRSSCESLIRYAATRWVSEQSRFWVKKIPTMPHAGKAPPAESRQRIVPPAPSPSGQPTKQPAPVSFPNQQYLQVLLEAMFDQLALSGQVPEASRTYEVIAAWINGHGWKTISDAFAFFNLPQIPANSTKLVDQCVIEFGKDYAASLIQKAQEAKRTNPPADVTGVGAWPWVFGIGGVLAAVGGTAYYLHKKKSAPLINPAKTYGHKRR